MAIFSMDTAMVQRSSGSSAVAHVAYVTGARIVDQRTGQESDYTRRSGVELVAPHIVLPASQRETQSAQLERGELWNLAEAAEKQKNSNPARKVLVALPFELNAKQRQQAVNSYAIWLADRYGVAVDYAIHAPDKEGDQRNFHAHMVMTTRQIEDGRLTTKSHLEWKGTRLKEAGLPSGKAMIHEMREAWERVHNLALDLYKPEVERVSCRTLQAQREAKLQEADKLISQGKPQEAANARYAAAELNRTPEEHVGWKATAMERRGIPTELSNKRKAAQTEHRTLIGQIQAKLLQAWEAGKAAIAKVSQSRQAPARPAPVPAPPLDPRITALKGISADLAKFSKAITDGKTFEFQHRHAEFLLDAVCGAPQGRDYLNRIAGTVAPGQVRNEPLYQFGVLKIRCAQNGQVSYSVAPDQAHLKKVGIHFLNASTLAQNDSVLLGRPPIQSNANANEQGNSMPINKRGRDGR